jgi:hypothetical protein
MNKEEMIRNSPGKKKHTGAISLCMLICRGIRFLEDFYSIISPMIGIQSFGWQTITLCGVKLP